MRAVIYKRVSTLDQAQEGYSLSAQDTALRKYCVYKGYTIVAEYADEGISGKCTNNRPGFMRMLQDASNKKYDVIVIWSLSRLSRSVSDLYNTWSILNRYNINIESQTENFDTSTAMGKAIFGLLAIFAQLESDLTSERVKFAAHERASQGKRTCNEVLGYDNCGKDTFTINANEAKIVKYIFDQYLQLKNLLTVSEKCDARSYKGKRGKDIKAESVKKILSNPIYVGFNKFHDNLYQGNHDPIINKETYNKVQALLHKPQI